MSMERYRPGDVFACWGTDLPSRTISVATSLLGLFAPSGLRLAPSHVAIACRYQKQILWVESTMLAPRPCLIREVKVSGCQAHRPEDRIADYVDRGGRVDVYRLSPIDTLSRDESERLTRILITHHVEKNLDYDLFDALCSGTFTGRRLAGLFGIYERAFCSELLAKTLMRLGRLPRTNANKFSPAGLMKRLVRDGTYTRLETIKDREPIILNLEGKRT